MDDVKDDKQATQDKSKHKVKEMKKVVRTQSDNSPKAHVVHSSSWTQLKERFRLFKKNKKMKRNHSAKMYLVFLLSFEKEKRKKEKNKKEKRKKEKKKKRKKGFIYFI